MPYDPYSRDTSPNSSSGRAEDTRVEAARLVAFEPEAHEEVRAQLTSSNSHRGTGIKYEGN